MSVSVGSAEFDAASSAVYVGWAAFDGAATASASIGWAEFDTLASGVSIGWAELDTQAAGACVGWAEFDAGALAVHVGWCELDCQSPTANPIPPYSPGGGVTRYHSYADKQYSVPVEIDEDEEEQIILQILMEIASHEL